MGDAPAVTSASGTIAIPNERPAPKVLVKKPSTGLIDMNSTIIMDVNELNAQVYKYLAAQRLSRPENNARYTSDLNAEFARLKKDIEEDLSARIEQSPDLTEKAAALALKNDLKGCVINYGLKHGVGPDMLDKLIEQAANEMRVKSEKRLESLRKELVGIRGFEDQHLDDLRKFKQFFAHVKAYIAARSGIDSGEKLVSAAKNLRAEILGNQDNTPADKKKEDRNNIDWVVEWAADDLKKERGIVRDMTPAAQRMILSHMTHAERIVAQAIRRADEQRETNNRDATLSHVSKEYILVTSPFDRLQLFDQYYYPSYDTILSKEVRASRIYLSMTDETVACLVDFEKKYATKDALKASLLQRAEGLTEPDLQEDFKKAATKYIDSLPDAADE